MIQLLEPSFDHFTRLSTSQSHNTHAQICLGFFTIPNFPGTVSKPIMLVFYWKHSWLSTTTFNNSVKESIGLTQLAPRRAAYRWGLSAACVKLRISSFIQIGLCSMNRAFWTEDFDLFSFFSFFLFLFF